MLKVYKILLFTYLYTISVYAKPHSRPTHTPPQLSLCITSEEANTTIPPQTPNFSASEYTHATYKITQATKKINTTLVRKEATLLMHLTAANNQITVQVSDIRGQLINATYYPKIEAGFYEIPVLPSPTQSQLYFVSLVINRETYSFQISPN